MGKHRNLNLDKLITLVQWDDVQRYLAKLAPDANRDHWAFINADALRAFMDAPENSDAAGIIMERCSCRSPVSTTSSTTRNCRTEATIAERGVALSKRVLKLWRRP